MNINGILLLDKPIGLTSNGALQRAKRLFKATKAGHTGSLDPLATGMLPLCFGEATKFSQFLLDSDKSYLVTAKLGQETTTGDAEGEVVATGSLESLTLSQIESIVSKYTGPIDQIPPMFSAIKHQGKPLYELARKGIEIERQPRRVQIYSLQLEKWEGDELTLSVRCSKGTYVRTLVQDIGRELGCRAHVIKLRRTYVAPYGDAMMYTLTSLEEIAEKDGLHALHSLLLPVESSVNIFPEVKLSTSAAFYLRQGQAVRMPFTTHHSLVRLVSEDARFIGMGQVMPDGNVKPMRLVNLA